MNKSGKTKTSKKTSRRTLRTSNTSTALYCELQKYRNQLIESEREMKIINKTLDSARADLDKDEGDNFYKIITLKNKILKKKDTLEDKIDTVKSNMKSIFLFIRKEGGRNRNKRKSRKKKNN